MRESILEIYKSNPDKNIFENLTEFQLYNFSDITTYNLKLIKDFNGALILNEPYVNLLKYIFNVYSIEELILSKYTYDELVKYILDLKNLVNSSFEKFITTAFPIQFIKEYKNIQDFNFKNIADENDISNIINISIKNKFIPVKIFPNVSQYINESVLKDLKSELSSIVKNIDEYKIIINKDLSTKMRNKYINILKHYYKNTGLDELSKFIDIININKCNLNSETTDKIILISDSIYNNVIDISKYDSVKDVLKIYSDVNSSKELNRKLNKYNNFLDIIKNIKKYSPDYFTSKVVKKNNEDYFEGNLDDYRYLFSLSSRKGIVDIQKRIRSAGLDSIIKDDKKIIYMKLTNEMLNIINNKGI